LFEHRRPAITGQNSASSGPAAKVLIETLNKKVRYLKQVQFSPLKPKGDQIQHVLQKVAVITGASQAIGAAVVNAYRDRKYRVVRRRSQWSR
jgi:hypothetical protein